MSRAIPTVVICLLLHSHLFAEDHLYRKGEWVVVTVWKVDFERDGQVVGRGELGDAYVVGGQTGENVWIPSMGGSLKTTQVVPYGEALEHFTKYVEALPELSVGYLSRATFLRKAGKRHEALADYNRAIELDPENALLLIGRGNLLRDMAEFAKADADYTLAIHVAPDEYDAWNGRGLARFHLEKIDAAITDFQQAIDREPNVWYLWNNRGNAYRKLKQYKSAASDYTTAIALAPRDPLPICNRAEVRWEDGDFRGALDDYQAAIDLYPPYIDTFISRGDRYAEIGFYTEAYADYTAAVRYQPLYPNGYAARGWLLATCPDARYRNGSLALSDATILCEKTKYQNTLSLKILAVSLAELGRFPEAIKWQTKATELVSDELKADYREILECLQRHEPYRLPRPKPRPPVEAPRS